MYITSVESENPKRRRPMLTLTITLIAAALLIAALIEARKAGE